VAQAVVRKDVERAFGVLHARFAIVRGGRSQDEFGEGASDVLANARRV
jgi:hypothetical protein